MAKEAALTFSLLPGSLLCLFLILYALGAAARGMEISENREN